MAVLVPHSIQDKIGWYGKLGRLKKPSVSHPNDFKAIGFRAFFKNNLPKVPGAYI